MTATDQFQDQQQQQQQQQNHHHHHQKSAPLSILGAGMVGAKLAGTDSLTLTTTIQAEDTNVDAANNIRPTKRRFFILFMYIVLQFIKSFQWICLASVTNVAAKYYQVDNIDINWTAILFMVTFLILALPVSWIMDVLGLRKSVLIGSIGVTIGVVIKCFSCHRDGFLLGMFGHLIVGLAEPFFFSSYSQVASYWFPDTQVAQATAFALMGEEAGLALGFIIPPMLIGRDPDDMDAVGEGLFKLFVTIAIISVLNTLSILFFFHDQPRKAPGIARWKQIEARRVMKYSTRSGGGGKTSGENGEQRATAGTPVRRGGHALSVANNLLKFQLKQLGEVLLDRNFVILLVGFGLNVGTAYSIHTLLNQMIMKDWTHASGAAAAASDTASGDSMATDTTTATNSHLIVGNSGLILIVAGLFGSAFCGSILDKFHRHKSSTAAIYLMTLVSMALLTYCLAFESAQVLYLIIVPLGFALTGYASCGFDYGVELTYPRAELLSATLLNMSAQVFGIPISFFGSFVVDNYGNQALGVFFCLVLALGFLFTCLQSGELRRQKAVNEGRRKQPALALTSIVADQQKNRM